MSDDLRRLARLLPLLDDFVPDFAEEELEPFLLLPELFGEDGDAERGDVPGVGVPGRGVDRGV